MANKTPKYSSDGKPLNEAARKAMNTAIKNSARGTQDRLNTLNGKTRIGNLARGGAGGGFLENLK